MGLCNAKHKITPINSPIVSLSHPRKYDVCKSVSVNHNKDTDIFSEMPVEPFSPPPRAMLRRRHTLSQVNSSNLATLINEAMSKKIKHDVINNIVYQNEEKMHG
jgi:hypothetical protein